MNSNNFDSRNLRLVRKPEKDFKFQIGDYCVLNSGGPLMEVVGISQDGKRICKVDITYYIFPSECLREHALTRIFKLNGY